MIQKKICMLGAYAVGKTSLVRRFVQSIFSEKYQTTVGVKIDKKEVQVGDQTVKLMLWDIHGEDRFQSVATSYLRGASGYFVVADGTRPDTLDAAIELHQRAQGAVGEVPAILLMNKVDLLAEWGVGDDAELAARTPGLPIIRTSAKTGDGVEPAFLQLCEGMLR